MFEGSVLQGQLKVFVGNPDSTQPAEFWAARAREKIMLVADTAPQPIRDQAYAFAEQMEKIIVGAIQSAVVERRARDALIAERATSFAVAQQIREDK